MEEVRELLTQAFGCCNPYCSPTIHIKLHFASCVSRKLKVRLCSQLHYVCYLLPYIRTLWVIHLKKN